MACCGGRRVAATALTPVGASVPLRRCSLCSRWDKHKDEGPGRLIRVERRALGAQRLGGGFAGSLCLPGPALCSQK